MSREIEQVDPFRARDRHKLKFKEKDSIIRSAINSMQFTNTNEFFALLMPAYRGPEIFILDEKGVPKRNIYVLERASCVWKVMKYQPRGYEHFKGVYVPPEPLPVEEGLEFVHADMILKNKQFDLIYFDFFGRPGYPNFEALLKLFEYKLLKPKCKLILTFGCTRCRRYILEVGSILIKVGGETLLPIKTLVDTAIRKANYQPYSSASRDIYRSFGEKRTVRRFVTSIFDW